ncbi:MAG: N-acetylmuramoyl-L-alanine amidase [Bacteroidales bacterium]|nr:N-acetylmuramoyl-L-alanine amidase [Bacteroidales bacterium]
MKKSLFILFAILALAIPQKALAGWSDYVIILDPGHGGDDCGATYNSGKLGSESYESWLVMNCAERVYNQLVAHGANVYATRGLYDDDFSGEVDLSPRRSYCYTYGSDLFVSFHLNAANASAHGTETYYSYDYSSSSSTFASTMQTALVEGAHGFLTVNGRSSSYGTYQLIDRGVKTANYSVIIAGEYYPSILTEGLFIDYVGDWQLIHSADTADPGFSAWVDGHLNGIYNYLKQYGNLTASDESGLYYQGAADGNGSITWSAYNNSETMSIDLSCKVGESTSYTVTLDGSNLNYWTTATLTEAAKNIGLSISQGGFAVDGTTHKFNPDKPTITITFTPKEVGTWEGWWTDGIGFQSNYNIELFCKKDVNGNEVKNWINFQCYATSPTAAITPSVTGLDLSCRLGESVSKTVTLYGAGLTSEVTVSAANASAHGVTVTPATLDVDANTKTFADGNNTVTITYTPTVAGTATIAKGITFSGSSVNGTLTSGLNLTCTAEAPAITPASSTLNLVCPEGQRITRTIALDGFGLTGNATATLSDAAKAIGITMTDENGNKDANGNVVLGVADNAFSPANPKLKLVFNPTKSFEASTGQYYITVSAPSLAGTAETKITLKPSVTTVELPLVEAWNKSEKLGTDIVTGTYVNNNKVQFTYDAKKIRNMEYYHDRLFCVYEQSRIRVLSARDNARLLYDLSNEGVSGGAVALADVKEFDGKIIACNIITSTSTDKTLKIYIWDDVLNYTQTKAPKVVSIDVTDLFTTDEINRIGDYIECDGTWDNGRIILSALELYNDQYYPMIYQYAVNKGEISTTKLGKAVAPITSTGEYLTCGNSLRATPTSYGFMINAAGILPTKVHYNHSPYADGLIADQMMNYEKWGNTYRQFEYSHNGTANTYALMLDYASPEYIDNKIVSGTAYRGGHMKLFRIINGTQDGGVRDWLVTFKQPTQVGMFPYEGLSDVNQNVNSTGNICVNTDGSSYLEAWILCTNQGIAYYRLGTQLGTGVEGTFSDEAVEKEVKSVEYVNMMGQRSLKPFEGVNIVVTTFTDGTTKAIKTIK